MYGTGYGMVCTAGYILACRTEYIMGYSEAVGYMVFFCATVSSPPDMYTGYMACRGCRWPGIDEAATADWSGRRGVYGLANVR